MRLAFVITFLLAPARRAQTTEIQTARSSAWRRVPGDGYDNSAVDMNPAGMVQLKKADFEGGYFRSSRTRRPTPSWCRSPIRSPTTERRASRSSIAR